MGEKTEIDQLAELLRGTYWHELTDVEPYDIDGFTTVARINGENRDWTRTVAIVTRGPSGQHYRWEFEEGLAEDHPDFGPAEYGDPDITLVHQVTETITVTRWVAEENHG
ncbi:hypothetical protein [Nocardia ignorata]|uniref:Uncharacterized protein n=1 Tax=Nocardia ignorata TaxID=145285 RepID=A0A4R6P0H2_NOCIG|nr:hypothetical protein [Nocardia ignorata]TDP29885.1 hypothetical protein DFR75_112154 [Nocardia ignorata]